MPSEGLPIMVVTSGLGVGVLAGVISGICYVVVQGFRNTGRHRTKYALNNPWQCCICGAHFRSQQDDASNPANSPTRIVHELRRAVLCVGCNGHACRVTCGRWLHGDWLCKQCDRNHVTVAAIAAAPTVSGRIGREIQTASVIGGSEFEVLGREIEGRKIDVVGDKKSWFRSILTAFQPNTVTVRMSKTQSSEVTAGSSSSSSNEIHSLNDIQNDEKEIVRDFIERLVSAMLGADLDDTSVSKLYSNTEYDAIFERYHGDLSSTLTDLGSALHISIANLPVTGQTPCTAHASLKNIIRRVLRDASNMAILKQAQNEPEPTETTTNRTYEDLLATAILNKVIDNYQTDLRRKSSSASGSSSKKSDSSKKHKHRRHHDQEERWRAYQEHPDLETTSVSSVEDWCRSESSGASKYVDHMSFTIQQSIEELSTSDDEQPSTNQYLHSNLSRNTFRDNNETDKSVYQEDWQENWLFSRKNRTSPKPVPVPMLVPNPTTDYRALIGDKDAEDTSDLSETGSDMEEIDSAHDIKQILVDSRTVIGGKNLLENINTEYLSEDVPPRQDEDGIDGKVVEDEVSRNGILGKDIVDGRSVEPERVQSSDDDKVSEATNQKLIHDTPAPYVESDSLGSNTEKDAEYTEKYASFPRKITKKSPMPSPRTSKDNITDEQRNELISQQNGTNEREITNGQNEDRNDELIQDDDESSSSSNIFKGSYSEKEKEKWKNPIALANNPYSKENLDKRLRNSSSSSDTSHTYGRDYYIREAKLATGGRKRFPGDDENAWIENSDHDYQTAQSLSSEDNSLGANSVDQIVFTALPAIIKSDEDIPEEQDELYEMESIPNSRPISLALSTDSEDVDVKRIYNLETGKVYTYKPPENIIGKSKSPEEIEPNKLVASNLSNENKFDENHNTTRLSPEPIMNISKLNHILNSANNLKNKPSTPTETNRKEFLQQQLSITEPDFDEQISKKYPQILVNNNITESDFSTNLSEQKVKSDVATNIISDYSTPPISLEEFETNNEISDAVDGNVPIGNLIDIEADDIYKQMIYNNKSCIDLRFVGERNVNNEENKSISSLNEERQYHSEDEVKTSPDLKSNDLEELENVVMPSVSDLKKLFDQDKPNKPTIQRTKSHLTTKPEFRAHKQHVHSLTARSLSKEFRLELQKNPDSQKETIVEAKGVEQEENADQQDIEIIPACKSKIQFFELLKNKN